jgi:gamma-glutamylcyclotransferase (GGCT)/AIG2-like uncharacterized protein YtfP
LRRGERHHAELCGAPFLGAVITEPAYRVVRQGGYPALVAGSAGVHGELYAVDAPLLASLDAFEGPGYRRAPVLLEDGTHADAYFGAGGAPE